MLVTKVLRPAGWGGVPAIPSPSCEKCDLDGFKTPKTIHTGEKKKDERRKGRKDEKRKN